MKIYVKVLIFQIIVAIFNANCIISAALNDGLIAYYPFNGNANDESGYGNHAFVHGSILVEDKFGNKDSAFSFDGLDDYILIKHSPENNFDITESFSISLYLNINPEVMNKPNGVSIIEKATSNMQDYTPVPYPYVIRVPKDKTSGELYYSMFDSSKSDKVSSQNIKVVDNLWHHVVIIKDKQNSIKLYIDNTLAEERNEIVSEKSSNDSDIFLGRRGGDSNENFELSFHGLMDEVRIYNRAISSSEVGALFNLQQNILFVSPNYKYIHSNSGTTTLNVNPNCTWTAFSVDDWLSIETGENFIKIHYDSNSYEYSRVGKIIVTGTGASGNIQQGIEIIQERNITECEYIDSDSDGIIDQWDICTQTAKNTSVYSNGCKANELYIQIEDLTQQINLKDNYIKELSEKVGSMYTEEQIEIMVENILTWGDTNGDGKIGLKEAIKALMISSGLYSNTLN